MEEKNETELRVSETQVSIKPNKEILQQIQSCVRITKTKKEFFPQISYKKDLLLVLIINYPVLNEEKIYVKKNNILSLNNNKIINIIIVKIVNIINIKN